MPSVRVDLLYKVAFLDPSTGQQKGARHSRSAIAVVGEDEMERVFILECWAAHATTYHLIDKFFKVYETWKPAIFGMDATGGQALFAQQLQQEARVRQIPIPLRPMSMHTDKLFQIETALQPISSAGRLFRPPESTVKELRDEWQNFPSDQYRDALDALSNAIRLLPSSSVASLKDLTRDQYRRFLERSGYTADDIERKLAMR